MNKSNLFILLLIGVCASSFADDKTKVTAQWNTSAADTAKSIASHCGCKVDFSVDAATFPNGSALGNSISMLHSFRKKTEASCRDAASKKKLCDSLSAVKVVYTADADLKYAMDGKNVTMKAGDQHTSSVADLLTEIGSK